MVSTQGLCREGFNITRPGSCSETGEEPMAQAQVLVVISNDECHLCFFGVGASLVSRDADEFATVLDDQGKSIHVIDVGQTVEFVARKFGVVGKIATVDGIGREEMVKREEFLLILRSNRAEPERSAASKEDARLELLWIES